MDFSDEVENRRTTLQQQRQAYRESFRNLRMIKAERKTKNHCWTL